MSQTSFTAVPPFDTTTAQQQVLAMDAAWSLRAPKNVTRACSEDTTWRCRDQILRSHESIEALLSHQWALQLHCRQTRELWAFSDNRIATHFECEWQHARTGQWYRSYGIELWAFDPAGYLSRRDLSANDLPILANDRHIGF